MTAVQKQIQDAEKKAEEIAAREKKASEELAQAKAEIDTSRKTADELAESKKKAEEIATREKKVREELEKAKSDIDTGRKTADELAETKKKAEDALALETKKHRDAIKEVLRNAAGNTPDYFAEMAAKADDPAEASLLHYKAAGRYLELTNLKDAEAQAKKAIEKARTSGDQAAQAKALRTLVEILESVGPTRIDDALTACDQGSKLKQADPEEKEFFEVTQLELNSLKREAASPSKSDSSGGSASAKQVMAVLLVAIQPGAAGPALPQEIRSGLTDVDARLKKAEMRPLTFLLRGESSPGARSRQTLFESKACQSRAGPRQGSTRRGTGGPREVRPSGGGRCQPIESRGDA